MYACVTLGALLLSHNWNTLVTITKGSACQRKGMFSREVSSTKVVRPYTWGENVIVVYVDGYVMMSVISLRSFSLTEKKKNFFFRR
ncbi:hypothetical protein CSUI_005417 [Cystoisospora suis]|uniref:Uncharacterized protein n=1 Tax=Cystoisospora suis TaxID=483139 RepID=A0A2C6KXN3_9APIC|nr:hypothetical protein CSUI_005417 [Cystoisospora suis]